MLYMSSTSSTTGQLAELYFADQSRHRAGAGAEPRQPALPQLLR
jgi:hypothetical protein